MWRVWKTTVVELEKTFKFIRSPAINLSRVWTPCELWKAPARLWPWGQDNPWQKLDGWMRTKQTQYLKLNELFKLGIEAYYPVWLLGAICNSRGVSSSSLSVHQVENSDHLLLLTEREREAMWRAEMRRAGAPWNFTRVLRTEEAEPSGRSVAHLDLPSLPGKAPAGIVR